MNSRPAWFAAAVLAMLALVVSAQLVALGFGVRICLAEANVVVERWRNSTKGVEQKPLDPAPGGGCDRIREDFKEAVERNGSLVLALLGGGGVAAAAAHGGRPPER